MVPALIDKEGGRLQDRAVPLVPPQESGSHAQCWMCVGVDITPCTLPRAYLLTRKPSASSASSPSTSSWLSVVPGTFHGKGLSGLSGVGKSRRSWSRKLGISSVLQAGGLLLCGAPEAMARASRATGLAARAWGQRISPSSQSWLCGDTEEAMRPQDVDVWCLLPCKPGMSGAPSPPSLRWRAQGSRAMPRSWYVLAWVPVPRDAATEDTRSEDIPKEKQQRSVPRQGRTV